MITEAVAAGSSGNTRMMGFVALQMFDIEIVEPLVRELLDTHVAGHAALWLISRGRADAETLGSFIDVAVLVDVFAAQSLENPEELCVMFTNTPDPIGLLEDMWRHSAPETALVLDALGQPSAGQSIGQSRAKGGCAASQLDSEPQGLRR